MATPEDIALSKRLLELADGIAKGDARVRNAMEKLVGSQGDLLDEYINNLDNTRKWSTQEAKEAKDRLIRLRKIELQETQVNDDYIDAKKKNAEQVKDISKQEQALSVKLSKARKQSVIAELQSELAEKVKERTKLSDELTLVEKTYAAHRAVIKQATLERGVLEKEQAKLSTQVSQSLRENFRKSVTSGIDKVFSDFSISKSLKEGYNYVTEAAATSAGISFGNLGKTATLGFKPSEFVKFQAEFRRAEVGMIGGQDAFVAGLEKGAKSYDDMIISPVEKSKLLASQFDLLTKSGVRPSVEKLTGFSDTIHKVSRMTGKKAAEITADLASIQEDESTQTLLKMASSEAERLSIIKGTQAVYANNVAMGMSTKQAIKAATQLNKLQAQTGKSRIVEAARIRALGGALGMGGQAARLAELRTKKQLTPEEKIEATKLTGELGEKLTQMKGVGGGTELFADALSESLDKSNQFGPSSDFNNTLGTAVAPLKDTLENHLPQVDKSLVEVASTLNSIWASITNNPLLTAILGLLSSSGVFQGVIAAATTATAYNTSVGGGMGSAGGVLGKVGKAGKLLKGVGGVAAGIGAAYGVYEGVTAAGTSGKKGAGYGELAGTVLGGIAGAFGGPAGAMVGAGIGGQVGKWLGSTFDTEENTKKVADATETVKDASEKTANTITEQLTKMDTTNNYLKTISENSANSVTLSEKMLVALSMSEKDRTSSENRSKLLKDNRFGSTYGYVG